MNTEETLQKSIDDAIDSFFAELEAAPSETEETMEKGKTVMDDLIGAPKTSGKKEGDNKAETTADEVKAKKPKKDSEPNRPEETNEVPDTDEDGNRAKGYNAVQSKNEKTPETSPKGTIVKSFEISEEDYEFLQKAKSEKQAEVLRKAQEEQMNLIKSAISEVTKGLKEENAILKKSLEDTQSLIKAMSKKPQPSKAVTNIQMIEKSFGAGEGVRQESFSKAEMLDVAEALVKAKKLSVEEVIELEDTGYIYNPESRKVLEDALRRQG